MSSMEYNESLVYKELLENSEKLAEDIMANIRRLGLDVNFTMDDLTLADGNCFFRGVLQQCRRPHFYSTLPDEVKGFVDNMRMKGHIRSRHTGEKPFPCRYLCGQACAEAGNRKKHEITTHGQEWTEGIVVTTMSAAEPTTPVIQPFE